jgi:hypothetical protein
MEHFGFGWIVSPLLRPLPLLLQRASKQLLMKRASNLRLTQTNLMEGKGRRGGVEAKEREDLMDEERGGGASWSTLVSELSLRFVKIKGHHLLFKRDPTSQFAFVSYTAQCS